MEQAEIPPAEVTQPKPISEILTPDQITTIRQTTEQLRAIRLSKSEIYAGDTSFAGRFPTPDLGNYTQVLLNLGVGNVNIVDFSAGGAETICREANKMADLVKTGRVHLTATNLYGIPTLEGLQDPEVKSGRLFYSLEHLKQVETALRDGNVEFLKADILELYEKMKGKPVHLMFIISVLPFTRGFEGAVITIVSEMLDRNFGTLVATNMDGLGVYMEKNDFRRTGVYSGGHGQKTEVFQGPKAPPFLQTSTTASETIPVTPPKKVTGSAPITASKNIPFWKRLGFRK